MQNSCHGKSDSCTGCCLGSGTSANVNFSSAFSCPNFLPCICSIISLKNNVKLREFWWRVAKRWGWWRRCGSITNTSASAGRLGFSACTESDNHLKG